MYEDRAFFIALISSSGHWQKCRPENLKLNENRFKICQSNEKKILVFMLSYVT